LRRSFSGIQLAKELAELLRPPPSNLPDLPYCVGRDGEIQTAKELLRERRLLTIVGPGGIGKTHLALQVAAEQADHYRHGAFFVPLAPLAEAEFILTAIAEALQFSFSGADDHQSQLLDYLRAKQMLLVMDGFERLLEGVGVVNQILETAPGMAIIVTSLERLNLEGEAVLEIPGMALPEGETLTDLESYSAFQLFVRSAQRVWSAFSPRPEDLPHIVRICRLVEGMPLGIELAAAWVRMLSCRDIADQVEASLGFLATHAAAPDGQRSMRAVFDYFWGLLSEAERSILRKLSVFRGGFHKEAAQDVTGASLFFLSALVDKALLRRNASGRYSMHEVLRQYAEEELDRSRGERALAQDLHSEVYASFMGQLEPQLRGGRQRRALEDIAAEIENVRAAWRWAVHRGRAESLLRSLNSLFRFYEVRSWFREGEETFRWAIETLSAERAEWRGTSADRQLLLARLASFRASLLISLSLHDEGRQLLWDCLPVFRRLDNPVDEATVLNRLGELARMVGEYDEARNYLEQALDGYRRSEDREGIAKSLFNLGVVAGMVGDFPRAKGLFQESLDLRVHSGDEHGVARCLNALGNISAMLGERPEARRLYEESLVLSKRVGDRWSMANCLNNLGVVAQEMGEHQAAIELCRESLAIYTEIGNRYGLALSLTILGGSSLALGEWMEGRVYLFQALRTAVEVQALPVSLEAMLEIATSMEMEGDPGRALEIVTLVMSHPAIDKDSASKAERIRERLRSSMTEQDFEAAQARGRQVTFDGVVAALLRQEALAAPSM
jgi:predicted ATPase